MSKEEVYSYFMKNNINILEKKFDTKESLTQKDIINQVNLIALFHIEVTAYRDNLIPRIGSTIGKDLENYKLQLKKLSMDIKKIEMKENKNLLEKYLLNQGPKIIEGCNKAIENIIKSDYRQLIIRGMRNYEVCLGKVDESNLKLSPEGTISIGTIKYLTYNIVEHDFCSYIKKISRKVTINNIDELMDIYVRVLELGDESKKYMKSMLDFPIESLRVLNKYRDRNKYNCDVDCLNDLIIAMKYDEII